MKTNYPTEITKEVLDTLSTNLHASWVPLKRWLDSLNDEGFAYSKEQWEKLSEEDRYKIQQEQKIASAWAQRNRTVLPTVADDKIIGLKRGAKPAELDKKQIKFKIVPDVSPITGKRLGNKIVFSGGYSEVGYKRAFDTSYKPIQDKDAVLDVHTIHERTIKNTVRWHDGTPFNKWYSSSTEDRYPKYETTTTEDIQ